MRLFCACPRVYLQEGGVGFRGPVVNLDGLVGGGGDEEGTAASRRDLVHRLAMLRQVSDLRTARCTTQHTAAGRTSRAPVRRQLLQVERAGRCARVRGAAER